jgi:hypothetical protein
MGGAGAGGGDPDFGDQSSGKRPLGPPKPGLSKTAQRVRVAPRGPPTLEASDGHFQIIGDDSWRVPAWPRASERSFRNGSGTEP